MSLYRADIAFRFVINRPNGSNTLKANVAQIERSGLDVFSFTAVAGLFDQFIGPSTAVVSASYAKQHGLTVGDVLHSKTTNVNYGLDAKTPVTIVAIYKDSTYFCKRYRHDYGEKGRKEDNSRRGRTGT